jgi:hypothetical protein
MSSLKKNGTSRRQFMKRAGQAAAGAAFATTVAQDHAADAGKPPPTDADNCKPDSPPEPWNRHNGVTKKIGGIAPHPDTSFSGQRRMPGWHADTIINLQDSNNDICFFPEELLLRDASGNYEPFPVPNTFPAGDPFDDSGGGTQWILGSPFKQKQGDAFDKFLAEIANMVRRYNLIFAPEIRA